MREEEKENITRHLYGLTKTTNCNTGLLQYLIQNGIFNKEEVDLIESKATPIKQATELYHIIQTKADFQTPYHHLLEGLRLTKQTVASEIILKIVKPRAPKVRKIVHQEYSNPPTNSTTSGAPDNIKFDVQDPVPNYTGRYEELEELHQKFCGSEGTRIACITGLGGVGKTQLARKYIQTYSSYFNENVVWLKAEDETVLAESFRRLAKDRLWISTNDANGGEKDTKTIVEEIYERFHGNKCLIVFDNVDTGDYINKFFPQGFPEIFVLMTTRDINYSIPGWVATIKLKEMKLEDAINFVRKGLGEELSGDPSTTKTLCTRLQCLPLTLQQAISFIEMQASQDDYHIKDYLEEFEKCQRELLDYEEFRQRNDYDKTTFTTWNMTVQKINEYPTVGKYSIRILHSMAYLLPEGIQREMFLPMMGGDKRTLRNAVGLLIRYSMISRVEGQKLLCIHRLVQEVTRIKLTAEGKDELGLFALMNILTPEEPPDLFMFIEHSLTAWKFACRHINIVQSFSAFPLYILVLLAKEVRMMEMHSFITGKTGLQRLQEVLPSDHEYVINLEYQLCIAQGALGLMDEAMLGIEMLIPRLRQLQKPEYVLLAECSLASMLHQKHRFAEALELYQKITEAGIIRLPLNQETKLDNLFHMADCFEKLGQNENAITLYQSLLPKLTEMRHSKEMTARFQIALLSGGLDMSKESEQVRKELFTRIDELDDKRKMSLILSEAENRYNYGNLSGALQVCEKALLDDVKTDNGLIVFHLIQACVKGPILRAEGLYKDASNLQEEAYQKILNIKGEEDIQTKIAKMELCATWTYRDKSKEAAKYLKSISESSSTAKVHNDVCKHFVDVVARMRDYKNAKYFASFVENLPPSEKTRLKKNLRALRLAKICG